MPENGPGGREVGRVSLRVLPDTSKFLPSLKKYAERVERQVALRISTSADTRGLEADVARISERVERTAPKIKVPMAPVSDGFAADLQAKVRAASRAIEANIPLNADGERIRRQVSAEVAKLEAELAALDIEVPLDLEDASRARLQLRERVAALRAYAALHAVEIPVTAGGAPVAGGSLSTVVGVVAGVAGAIAVLGGGVIAALPATLAAIAAPVAAIVLGFEGIARAAEIAQPAFELMRGALSTTFVEALAPAFQTLAEILPQITPGLEAIATALSGQFTTFIDTLAEPENIATFQSILSGIAEIIEAMTPAIGPFIEAMLSIGDVGVQAFADAAPALADALIVMSGVFQSLSDSGVIDDAVRGFAAFVIGLSVVIGAISAVLVWIASFVGKIVGLAETAGTIAGTIVGHFDRIKEGIAGAIESAVSTITSLPGRVIGALSGLGELLFASGAELIAGFIRGIYSMLEQVATAASSVAATIRGFFPGSPVKEGPLTSWNDGGAGKRLGSMLADGLMASKSVVAEASRGMAGAVATPAMGTDPAAGGPGSFADSYALRDIITDGMRQTPLMVDTRDNARQVARERNARAALA